MKSFTSHKLRSTAKEDLANGTTSSRHLLACTRSYPGMPVTKLIEDSYLLSLSIPKNLMGKSLSEIFSCDTTSLRGVNALALTALANFALLSRWEIEARLHEAQHPTKIKAPSRYAIHSAFNIALCPVIFFFSGLYYTDVASTAVVLAAFLNSLKRMGRDKSSFLSDLLTICLGILSLLMRQTNVFWVVVFLGGLEAVHAVKTLRPQRVDEPSINTVWGRIKFFSWRYSLGDIHDPPSHASWEDGTRSPSKTLDPNLPAGQTCSSRHSASPLRQSATHCGF